MIPTLAESIPGLLKSKQIRAQDSFHTLYIEITLNNYDSIAVRIQKLTKSLTGCFFLGRQDDLKVLSSEMDPVEIRLIR